MEKRAVSRSQALEYISYVLDDQGKELPESSLDREKAWLVGWQVGFEPLFVAVQGDMPLSEQDADEIATEFLTKKKWLSNEKPSDYIIPGKKASVIERLDRVASELESVNPVVALVLDRISDRLEGKTARSIDKEKPSK